MTETKNRKPCPPELRAKYMQDPYGTRLNSEKELILRALREPEFRAELKKNPKQVLKRELDILIPDEVKVNVIEETAHTVTVVIPYVSPMREGKPSIAEAKESLSASAGTGATCVQFGSCC